MQLSRGVKSYFRKLRKIKILQESQVQSRFNSEKGAIKESIFFNPSSTPKVSIIIPFFNQQEYTWNCLNSLNKHLTQQHSYEIILIDDNSTAYCDFTLISGVKIIRNQENKGFLRNINLGIQKSKGEFVYILNNDTEVQKGFLNELFYVFENFPNVGAVGSKLINADGTLQEAGSVFMKDCNIHQIVKNKEVYYPQVNYIYQVDYCSGCSLLFRKRNENGELNLFDEQFVPAYFEETDFCFQLKYLQNKNVYYTPFSEVIHFNGVTYNDSKNTNTIKIEQKEALFKLNLGKFKTKWFQQLKDIQASTVESRIAEIYNNNAIVFFCNLIPEYDKDSGSNRFKEIIQCYIELGFQVTLIKNKMFIGDNPYIEFYQRMGVNVYYEHHKSVNIAKYLHKNNLNSNLAWFYNPDVFIEFYSIAKKTLINAQLIYDMIDIHHLRYERALEFDPANKKFKLNSIKYKRIELTAAKKADKIIAISEFEKNYMVPFCGREKIIIISNLHDIKIEKDNCLPFEDRNDILFIGSKHTPNIDAIYFLYNQIMPVVWKEIPNLKVNIIGNVKNEINDIVDPRINFEGYVHDLKRFFISSKIMVAPLRYGAGVKGKIGQAFEYFLPVVTTSVGAEGMFLENGSNALINDSPAGFAESIIKLYNDKELWEKLQTNSEKSLEPFSKHKIKHILLSLDK